ncbi:MAG: ATP-binding protein [Deltaproteobacteria bacterium]|nr:ATP-binding protein [Deltaproteobacteria bacterium]
MGYLKKRVNHLVGEAIHRYGLLQNGDRILVAVSGGSDSLLLLWFLNHWLKKAPINYSLLPVYLDMGFHAQAQGLLPDFFRKMGLSFHMEATDYAVLAHSSINRGKSPCFLCAMWRRKRLFQLTAALGCNKLALGHNQDDLIETFFLNLCYAGEMSTMVPRQEMFKGRLTIIRPLALVAKERIDRMAQELGLPVSSNPCPSAGKTRREAIKSMLATLYRTDRRIRDNIFRGLSNVRREYLL